MSDRDWLAARFEDQRPRLRAVAYRMLGSTAEAEDAVQDTWLRLSRVDPATIENLAGWLTTVVARVCLDALRARRARPEQASGFELPDPILTEAAGDPEQAALLADSVGIALLVVLETLSPAERLAFVLHDTFGVPFEEIAAIVGRSEVAARQLASRARRRVRGARTEPDGDVSAQRDVVHAFVAAARSGDFGALLAVLDPDVVLRADAGARGVAGATSREVSGAAAVARTALGFRRFADGARDVLVNGAAGLLVEVDRRAFAVVAFTVRGGRVAAIDILADADRLASLDLGRLGASS